MAASAVKPQNEREPQPEEKENSRTLGSLLQPTNTLCAHAGTAHVGLASVTRRPPSKWDMAHECRAGELLALHGIVLSFAKGGMDKDMSVFAKREANEWQCCCRLNRTLLGDA
ncbi:hypothetical protein ERJ75_001400400 [Trypanosoma vivax]|nr:hypothetical protein ERJ75_001400400 [Trypanosoma vivax]